MTDTTIAAPTTGAELAAQLGIVIASSDDMAMMIAMREANAATPEELFSDNGTTGWSDRLGEPFIVHRLSWVKSSMKDGIGFFAVVTAEHAKTGEIVTLTTGAVSPCIRLARAAQMGWLDRPLKMVQSETATADGYYPQRLLNA